MMGRKRSAKATGSGFKEIPSSENLSLGERLSYMDKSKSGIVTHSGRGHGRSYATWAWKTIKQFNQQDERCFTLYGIQYGV